jgi:DNA-binding beta-propeller fold protein YncE
VTLSGIPISDPAGVALGPDGRLWVANCTSNAIAAYALTGGAAEVVLTSVANAFSCPLGIAFDFAGNLWVANADGGVAERFPAGEIQASSGAVLPDVTLTPPPGATQPYGVALDAQGNVWVSFCAGSAVARYAATDAGGVSATAAAVLTQLAGTPPSLDCPVALALDNSGELFVANASTPSGEGPSLSWFAASDMADGGAAVPKLQLTNVAVTVGGLAFYPTATNLPILH